ncbi:MAG: ABC transporter permease, partial [Janthinobacterium lividum]
MSATIETTRQDVKPAFSLGLQLLKLRTFIALFVVVVFFGLAAPNFASAANVILISKQVAINAILSLGMTFVIITGGI